MPHSSLAMLWMGLAKFAAVSQMAVVDALIYNHIGFVAVMVPSVRKSINELVLVACAMRSPMRKRWRGGIRAAIWRCKFRC